jgi:histidyl-tRNA synthetase
MSKLDTGPYKGVRDFYPEDQFIQNHIFNIWKSTVEKFGFSEYGASILEPSDLYKAKTGEEIVNEQTYTFIDRGGRDVTLRPEMTPTLARMISARSRELAFPLRWYSIPNLFRYEAPQRGRLREHWQLNADIFGVDNVEADVEIINIAHDMMINFGASQKDFVIRINSRKVVNKLFSQFKLDSESSYKLSKLLDKKDKMPEEEFRSKVSEIMDEDSDAFISIIGSTEKIIEKLGRDDTDIQEILIILDKLSKLGIKNTIFDQTLMRGFDYYTGMVFEVFDTNPDNKRSLFGGGRYDELTALFDKDAIPAVGFGSGDVIIRDFLETRGLLPEYKPTTELYIAVISKEYFLEAAQLANSLRQSGISSAVDWSSRKIGDQIKTADKQKVPYVLVIGEDEIKSKKYKIKHLESGSEETLDKEGLIEKLGKE